MSQILRHPDIRHQICYSLWCGVNRNYFYNVKKEEEKPTTTTPPLYMRLVGSCAFIVDSEGEFLHLTLVHLPKMEMMLGRRDVKKWQVN